MEITILPISQIKEIQHDISDMLRPLNNVEYLILKASIDKYGLLSPVIVGEYNGKYILLDGSSRIHIYREFVKTQIECVILPITGIDDAIRKSYIFNTARRNMSPPDVKRSYAAFREYFPLDDNKKTATVKTTVVPAQTLNTTEAADTDNQNNTVNAVKPKRPRTPAQLAHDQKMRDMAQARRGAGNNSTKAKLGVDRSQVQTTQAVMTTQKSQESTEFFGNSSNGEPVEHEWTPDTPFE